MHYYYYYYPASILHCLGVDMKAVKSLVSLSDRLTRRCPFASAFSLTFIITGANTRGSRANRYKCQMSISGLTLTLPDAHKKGV